MYHFKLTHDGVITSEFWDEVFNTGLLATFDEADSIITRNPDALCVVEETETGKQYEITENALMIFEKEK